MTGRIVILSILVVNTELVADLCLLGDNITSVEVVWKMLIGHP
jgi:hypothetical protein